MEGPQTSLFQAVASVLIGQTQEGMDSGEAVLDSIGKELWTTWEQAFPIWAARWRQRSGGFSR